MNIDTQKSQPLKSDFQNEVKAKGEEIFRRMESEGTSIFNKDWWYGRIMEWSMKNEKFKVQMFRFVDVLPYLNSGSEVARHLKEYFAEGGEDLPSIFNMGVGLGSLAPSLMAGAVRKNVTQMAKMFITGENPKEALSVLVKSRQKGIGFTVDILGEATLSEKEALDYQAKYIELINWLAKDAETWAPHPTLDSDHRGAIPRVNVSVKLSSLYSQVKAQAWEKSKQVLKERLVPIFQLAKERNVFINLDMEHYGLKDLTLEIFSELIQEPAFKDYPHWGIVIQAYLRDSYRDCERMIQLAKTRKVPFTIRLVKGAYWDYETVHSEQQGWPIPVYTNKQESDANYERCAFLLLDHYRDISLAMGSHNVRSVSACLVYANQRNIPQNAFEIQMLYGMAEPIKKSLSGMGYRVRDYAPVGELIPGMAYLVRRLLENTSNESFLRSKFAENASTDHLLKDPNQNLVPTSAEPPVKGFRNEPLLDFGMTDVRQKFLRALEEAKRGFGKTFPLVVGKKEIKTDRTLSSTCPFEPELTIGKVHLASAIEAEQAVQAAKEAFPQWKRTRAEDRAKLLDRLADHFAQNRMALAATQVYEVGKQWKEADGDVCEAIDFCRYYANHMRELAKAKRVGSIPGETSFYHYQPRGVALVIAPWNFPLAILIGMVAAAAVTGNTVIMKPAEQSSIVAAQLMEAIRAVGFPPGVINFLPGYGEEVGEYLVNHKDIAMIAFTGSKDVGLHILKAASLVHPGQTFVKKCIIEMGGKNALIVDSDADMDEAVQGALYSAFGFQGQKCSAASRLIVLEENYDRFVERLVEAAKSMSIGPADDPQHVVGAVIDTEAQKRILATIEDAKRQFPILYQGAVPSKGCFVPPTIFGNVDPKSRLAQEEIFGPVLAVLKAKDLDEAIAIANDVAYGLTGGVYSRSPANIERVKRELEVGNLYVNRGITGAMVDRHPFGGFKLSGVGSKTGGPDYLLQFLEPRCVTENTMRRGFAPSTEDVPEY